MLNLKKVYGAFAFPTPIIIFDYQNLIRKEYLVPNFQDIEEELDLFDIPDEMEIIKDE
jgi:hypothetical protein